MLQDNKNNNTQALETVDANQTPLQAVFDDILSKAGRKSEKLWRGYQTRDNKTKDGERTQEVWKYVGEDNATSDLARIAPMFSAVCASNYRKNEGEVSKGDALYISDFAYFDFDADSIKEVIPRVRQFVGKLVDLGADVKALRLYASGGKGFHVMVPMEMLLLKGAASLSVDAMATLHHIVKALAESLFVDTLDMKVYTAGRQWRRANVKRVSGKYKVSISHAELLVMDEALYEKLTSRPREEVPHAPAQLANGLAVEWLKARKAVQKLVKAKKERDLLPKVALTPEIQDRYTSALYALDPDAGGYDAWRNAVAATHHLFNGSEAGFALIDAWSQQGKKYKTKDLRTTWDGFSDTLDAPVTDATVFDGAYKAGWVDPYPLLNPKHNPVANPNATPVYRTETGIAEFIAKEYEGNLLYVVDLEFWFFWNGKVWERDDDAFVLNRLIKETGRKLRVSELAALDQGADPVQGVEEIARLNKRKAAINTFYDRLESNKTVSAIKNLMLSEAKRVKHEELDADDFLLNVQNGILDLRTKELLKPDSKYLMTKITNVAYEKDAPCPTFLKYMGGVSMERKEWVDFMQQCLGYSLTGDTRIQFSYWLHGGGENGKSTLVNTIGKVLGAYAMKLPIETFLVSRKKLASAPAPHLINAPGVRFVYTSEMASGSQLDESQLKNIVSTDPLPARKLYANRIAEIRPKFKLWPPFNELPKIASTENGVWRRICPFPFDADFKERDRAKRILGMESLLEKEQEGILAWCVEGFSKVWTAAVERDREAPRLELNPPKCCTDLLEQYRDEYDIIKRFVTECLIEDQPEAKYAGEVGEIPAALLFDSYMYFCQRLNLPKVSNTRFGRDIKKYLPNKVRVMRGSNYQGWQILDVWVSEASKEREMKRPSGLEKAMFITTD